MTKKIILLLLIALQTTQIAWSQTYYTNVVVETESSAKGLVYATGKPASINIDNNLFRNVFTFNYAGNNSQSSGTCVIGKPKRGYVFNDCTVQSEESNYKFEQITSLDGTINYRLFVTTNITNKANAKTTRIQANWEEDKKYIITYKGTNNGLYTVKYSYLDINSDGTAFVDGSFQKNIMSSNEEVISYASDNVTLSTTLSSFEGWYKILANGNETLLSKNATYTYTITENATIIAKFASATGNIAKVTADGTSTDYPNLHSALEAAGSCAATPTVQLLDNIFGLTEPLKISSSINIDLNGKMLNGNISNLITITENANVTLKDNSADKSGKIYVTGNSTNPFYGIYVESGKLNLKSGNIDVQNSTTSETAALYVAENQSADLEGGNISCNNSSQAYGIINKGIVTISDCNISATSATDAYAIRVDKGSLTINSGKLSAIASDTRAYSLCVSSVGNGDNNSCKVNILGGIFLGKASGICANIINQTSNKDVICINGGYFTHKEEINPYISENKHIFFVCENQDEYYLGCRYLVASRGDNNVYVARIYDDYYTKLEDAIINANSMGGASVILVNDYVLDSPITIGNGVTLVIPNQTDIYEYEGLNYSQPKHSTVYENTSAYVTLSMTEKADITVNGDIYLAGSLLADSENKYDVCEGSVTGLSGCIDMSNGGKITLKSGSTLCAMGFILGQDKDHFDLNKVGNIIAESGSKVYESFAIGDYRHGSITVCLAKDNTENSGGLTSSYKVFPVNQYFIPNIEVPMTLNYGAEETVLAMVWALKQPNETSIDFIGSKNSMFTIDSERSSITKWYNPTTDHTHYDIEGKCSINSLTMNMSGQTFSSENLVLPITSDVSISVKNGEVNILNDVALLPGAKVTINKGASVNVKKNMYVYDCNDWGKYAYNKAYYTFDNRITTYNKRAGNLDDAEITINGSINVENGFFTTTNGANIKSDGNGKIIFYNNTINESVTYQVNGTGSSKDNNQANKLHWEHPDIGTCDQYCTTIPVTTAQLKNIDDSYTKTTDALAGTTFIYEYGRWKNPNNVLVGDVDGDGVVDVADATEIISHYLAGTTNELDPKVADVDGDGVIDIADATEIIDIYIKNKK